MSYAKTICQEHSCPDFAVHNGRCSAHARANNRKQHRTTPTKRTRTWTERQRRAAAVRTHRQTHGDWCPGYKAPAHPATDLTAEHITAVADSLDATGELAVLCRSCNSRHGAETKAFYYK